MQAGPSIKQNKYVCVCVRALLGCLGLWRPWHGASPPVRFEWRAPSLGGTSNARHYVSLLLRPSFLPPLPPAVLPAVPPPASPPATCLLFFLPWGPVRRPRQRSARLLHVPFAPLLALRSSAPLPPAVLLKALLLSAVPAFSRFPHTFFPPNS